MNISEQDIFAYIGRLYVELAETQKAVAALQEALNAQGGDDGPPTRPLATED